MMQDDAALRMSQAVAAHQAGHLAEAETLYRQVLDTQPNHADACALLGAVLGACGRTDEALDFIDRALVCDPNSGLFHFHRGTVLMAAQRIPQAIAALTLASELQPDTAQIYYNLANALRAGDDWTGAITHYRVALRCDAAYLPAYNNLALSLVHEKEYSEAQQVVLQGLARDARYGDAWVTLCNVAEKLKEYDTALMAGQRAVELIPANHYAWFGLGVALNRLNRDDEAITAYRKALAIEPTRVEAWDNLAQTYQALNRLAEAEENYRRAVEIAGQMIVDEEGRVVAEEEYGNHHWHLAIIELLRGNYARGFAHYRARFKAIPELKRLSIPCPLWRGEDLTGKSLLVCDEQGYGDTLMLARFLPLLRARGVRVVFSVHPVLAPFLRGWDGADQVIAHQETVPPCDFHCSSFDLPYHLGVTLDNLPSRVPYLPVLAPDAATLLPPSDKKRIGVVWGGSPLHKSDAKRSVPLRLIAELLSLPNSHFYSFNRDIKAGDAELLPTLPLENLAPRLTDFAVAARLLGQMDLIITCDSATAHLAGGLGKSVWVMLPFSPDWRWLTDRTDSPWYPTARLFRQPKPDDWGSVIAEIKTCLMNDPA